jgi:hypothetical protein
MSLPDSVLAYGDCKDFLERALEAERGARMIFRTSKDAEYWRMRCNQFRKLDRKQNRMVFEPGHKMHGHSEYDIITMTVKYSPDGYYWVYAQKMVLEPGRVEEIPEDESSLLAEFEEVKLLEHRDGDKASS